jgi:hypothetical protein
MALRVTLVVALTALVVTVNVAEVLPEATVTDAGTVAATVFELVSVTTVPAAGAGPVSVTVPVTAVVLPPFTLVGLTTNLVRAAG